MLEAFKANPVVLYNHDDGSCGLFGTGRKDVLPIGKARACVQGDALLVDIEFDQEDAFARKVESKVARGILNAVSVRYLMHRYHENERGGFDCEHQVRVMAAIVGVKSRIVCSCSEGGSGEECSLAGSSSGSVWG
jgi:phage head maturation protease|nr:hypothetical protein MFMH1_34510 [Myxococcus sp. MH1]